MEQSRTFVSMSPFNGTLAWVMGSLAEFNKGLHRSKQT